MKTILFAIILAAALPAKAFDFFENSQRRDGDITEARPIVKLNGCTGFFVSNSQNRALIATARHCFGFQEAKACENGGLVVTSEFDPREQGTCKKVVAGNSTLDMIIFEFDFPNWKKLSKEVSFLKLSAQYPQTGTQLKTLGYPTDRERNGSFTVTEGCWITEGPMVQWSDLTPEEQQANIDYNRGTPDPVVVELRSKIQKKFASKNNCSVYGGNSGGPILIHGTSIVLGLPTAFFPGATYVRSSNYAQGMDATADFIQTFAEELKDAGVRIVKPYKD